MTYNLAFHEEIARVSLDRFQSLPKSGKPTDAEWTILSAIVKCDDGKFEVVSLGTGTKCIGKSKMSARGDVLNDSHAEVICRRAFLLYIYNEMLKSSCSFLKLVNNKFVMKASVSFHFFTTHVPCGDASIFLKSAENDIGFLLCNNNDAVNEDERPAKRKCCEGDIFRTGAKCLPEDVQEDPCGNGFEYHVTGAVRTKPGRGDRTLSVSCSDKLAKWCYLGIQGCLLGLLLEEPIYLKSFTIAGSSPFSKEALNRALYNRFPTVNLRKPYKRHEIEVAQVTTNFLFSKDDKRRPCPTSIIYSNAELKTEVAVEGRKQGVAKKNLNKLSSLLRICKLSLFKLFHEIVAKHTLLKNLSLDGTYKDVKAFNSSYIENWDTIKRTSFKIWTSKDTNLLEFNKN